MDWFQRLTGFREAGYADTQRQLVVEGDRLRSLVNGKTYGIGRFEQPSLGELRARVKPAPGRLKVSIVTGDVRKLHQQPEYAGALFQVASQFNVLEMPSPSVTPEAGVTGYQHDRTQGPACALAAGAATIYRNYFVPCHGGVGQTGDRQLDGLADLCAALSELTGLPVPDLWRMQNGYALASNEGLQAISAVLGAMDADRLDSLRARLRIGVHADVEVTDVDDHPGPVVSQAFCSALPVAYTRVPPALWAPFASLVLEGAYEATLLAAAENAQAGGSNVVLLTHLGGGVFGNDDGWIHGAMHRALELARGWALDVRIVCYSSPSRGTRDLAAAFG
jgi:hypothetical protein